MINRLVKILALGLLLPISIAMVTACDAGGERDNPEEQEEPGNLGEDEGQNQEQDEDEQDGDGQEDGEQNEQDDDND